MSKGDNYFEHVRPLEESLAPYAKRSLETFSPTFLNGVDIAAHFQKTWEHADQRLKLRNRTPIQLERDRILYSDPMRKQTEKYHVLFNGQRRIVRNYSTHTMRMAQVARSICRGLNLNSDFAEAIAIGSKVGAVPFIHAAKEALSDWARSMIWRLDKAQTDQAGKSRLAEQLTLEFGQAQLPTWVRDLKSPTMVDKVRRYIPWAAGSEGDVMYSSGRESYWLLCTNPFITKSSGFYTPETMYGVWRHSRGVRAEPNSFHHRFTPRGAGKGHEITWKHSTYEASIVQSADDITWSIENLNDANNAALLNHAPGVYPDLITVLGKDTPEPLMRALTSNDAGGIYTYFIADFVGHSQEILDSLQGGDRAREALRQGKKDAEIGLSAEAQELLDMMVEYLRTRVFKEPRVRNRTSMLKTVAVACVELLYDGKDDVLLQVAKDRATLEKWKPDELSEAISLLNDDVHRIQIALDVLATMSDQEIYDFVGIQAL